MTTRAETEPREPPHLPSATLPTCLSQGLRSGSYWRGHGCTSLNSREITAVPSLCNFLEIHLLAFAGNLPSEVLGKTVYRGVSHCGLPTPLQKYLGWGAGGGCWLPGVADVWHQRGHPCCRRA